MMPATQPGLCQCGGSLLPFRAALRCSACGADHEVTDKTRPGGLTCLCGADMKLVGYGEGLGSRWWIYRDAAGHERTLVGETDIARAVRLMAEA